MCVPKKYSVKQITISLTAISALGFELWSPCPFPIMVTKMPQMPSIYRYKSMLSFLRYIYDLSLILSSLYL